MATRRSPLTAILLLGICVFQLGLGGSGVCCVTGSPGANVGAAHVTAGPTTDAAPCHGEMAAAKDTRTHHTPHSQTPGRSGGCQPMAACAGGFVPAVTQRFVAAVVRFPASAIAMPVRVSASPTFPPEPPPPRA